MKVRTRLLLAFSYILLTVIVSLEVPAVMNLEGRALAEVKGQALTQAQTIAGAIEMRSLTAQGREELQRQITDLGGRLPGQRVVVTDADGELIADSSGPDLLGENYLARSRPELEEALDPAGGAPGQEIRYSDTLGQEILATAVPVIRGNEVVAAVRITESLADLRRQVSKAIIAYLVIGLAGLVAGLAIAWVLAGTFSRPLTALAGTARRLGDGDLSARAEVRGSGEIADLAAGFNAMAGRLEATVRAQREFVANASHQLRTPLTGLKLQLESAALGAGNPEVRAEIEAAEREADRLSGLVDRLLVLARRVEDGEPVTIADLDEAARRAADRWRERATVGGASVEVRGRGRGVAAAVEDLDQILDNLLDNAMTYAPGDLAIELGGDDGEAVLAVVDGGPGIPPEERKRVLERFYRGRAAPSGGSGLGLAIVRELAQRSGGDVRVLDAPGGGTRVEVRLPASAGV